jgi:hypothetical protein
MGKLVKSLLNIPTAWNFVRGRYASSPEFANSFREFAEALTSKNYPAMVTAAHKLNEEKQRLMSLVKKDNRLDYYYLLTELKNAFQFYKFNWENKPTIEKIKPIEILIPINSKGEFDLEAQKEIAEKYRKIEQIKKSISAELDKIANIEIDYE